jgi:radical SAM enzyme (TIGR01210 family)
VIASAADQRIRGLRPVKAQLDPYAAQGWLIEDERRPAGKAERALTVFLTGSECPFTCSFCDLWRYTIDGPTPAGALTQQLKNVFSVIDGPLPQRLKLYNASNFFDLKAVPSEDLPGIAALSRDFSAVTVESHANMIGPRTLDFARQIHGRLEVAMGLETIHPVASRHINKRLDIERFDMAARFLKENGIDIRVFVLLGAPYVLGPESSAWTARTVEYALERGASVVSIIPVRAGNGEIERLAREGHFNAPSLTDLEDALDKCLELDDAVVTADLWDIERLSACEHCKAHRIERLKRVNLTGERIPRLNCHICNGRDAIV